MRLSCSLKTETASGRIRDHGVARPFRDRATALEAVMARHAAFFCRDGIDRQRTLQLLDAEIKEVNDLIAAQCRG